MSDDAIRQLVEENPGQATFDEYRLVRDVVAERAPCDLLVFGVGRDSPLWIGTNEGGRTVFLEDVRAWADFARSEVPGIVVHGVRYRTLRVLWPFYKRFPQRLSMGDLPVEVGERHWDVVLVDAPRGTRWYRPGRMKSIYAASRLADPDGGDVFVHDCHRRVEDEASHRFLGADRLVAQAGSMRHYRLG